MLIIHIIAKSWLLPEQLYILFALENDLDQVLDLIKVSRDMCDKVAELVIQIALILEFLHQLFVL